MTGGIIINIKDITGVTINTREVIARILSDNIENSYKSVTLNFKDVEFISRSFAEELIVKQQKFESEGVILRYTNVNEEVLKMLDAVSRTQNKIDREFEKVPVYEFTNRESLKEYLLSI